MVMNRIFTTIYGIITGSASAYYILVCEVRAWNSSEGYVSVMSATLDTSASHWEGEVSKFTDITLT